jgi:threonine/homoserine/homoserine lactone efflux protein
MVHDLAAFLAVSALVICSPGQDTALVIRNSLMGGRRNGVLTALGVASGQVVWTVATAVGLSALLRASEPAFLALRLAGAAYLVFLGAQSLIHALRGGHHRALRARVDPSARVASKIAYHQGLLSNLGNPKMAVFFTSLLPQFDPGGGASFVVLLLLGLTFCLMTFAWLSGYAFAVAKASDVLLRPRIRRALDALTGAVLVALGLRVAAEPR